MNIICLDLEGVLIPEIWQSVAERTGIEQLRLTTRDIADYDELMALRLQILDQHGIRLPLITECIEQMEVFPTSQKLLERLRRHFQIAILSDTFYEFAGPFMTQLGDPLLLCHHLATDSKGKITGYRLRQNDSKRVAVQAFQRMGMKVLAAGDSLNDLAMLREADAAVLFCARSELRRDYPQYPTADNHEELADLLLELSHSLDSGPAAR